MGLDERKVTILKAIIKTYLETGEPVGSRTISKYTDLKLSSATIRNEMSDLEEMGYIVQPHTSAGRIPSDQGYRFYVDQIMQEKEQEVTEVKQLMIQRVDRVELILKRLAELLANNTNYAAMISGPQYHRNKLKFIQLSQMENQRILIVVVVEGNLIKNTMVDLPESLSQEELLNLNILLNSALNGLTIEEINLEVISRLKEQAGEHSQIVDLVLNEVARAIRADEDDLQIYTSGATNIFKYPELSDGEKASQLISTLEQKDKLQELIADVNESEENSGIQVYIGDEAPLQTMRDCSVVTANYELGEGIRGTIGIIGPKRMDYEKVLGTLKNLMKQLDATFKNEER
ncbi:MAG: heat-inducible transcriptional repressor HrcA [Lachnospiraceae bacterium]|nr:heat-inducible transcriptional repressor HrcA [Lachnospiraceae bacterium]